MKKLYNKAKNDLWQEDDVCMTVIARYGTGGGNVPIVLQRRFSNIIVQDTEIAPTIEAGGGEGGNNVPVIVDTLVFDNAQITSKLNYSHPTWGGNATLSQAQPEKQ